MKPREAKDLRQLILEETRHQLVTDGYKNLSMRKIARAIGYSATSIYLYFENKDALFHALIDEGMTQMYDAFQDVQADCGDDPVVCLQRLCHRYVAFGLENPEYYEVMFMLHPEHMARYPAEKYRRARRNLAFFTQALIEGTAEGVLDVPDPGVATAAIWASLHGIVALLIARRVDVKIEADHLVEAVVAQIMHGYTTPAAAFRPG